MKNLKFLFFTLAIAVLAMSCEDDGGTSKLPIDYAGAVPNISKSATTDAFYDLVKVGNGQNVSVTVNADIAQGSPASTDIVGMYTTLSGGLYHAVLFTNVTLPGEFAISINDIVAAFSEISSSADIELGDVLTVTTRFTMADGTVLNIRNADGSSNLNSNLTNSGLFVTEVSYPVSCPSDIGGDYSVISNGDNTDGQPPAVDFPYDVTLTDLGGGTYNISEFSGGVYYFWYSIYGVGPVNSGTFTDVCGTISGTFSDPWGQELPVTGAVSADGTVTISWTNPWGDYLTSVLTPK